MIRRYGWLGALLVGVAAALAWALASGPGTGRGAVSFHKPVRTHLDHGAFFPDAFASPKEVTSACLRCHPNAAADFMKTSHWQWLGAETVVPGHAGPKRIGKKNLLNNFCISIAGNQASCTKCHAGYGWKDDAFDFGRQDAVDCLVCHDRSGQYVKGEAGMPQPGVDLVASAKSVGFPRRENCTACHGYGGGGQGVKHGDLDGTLDHPYPDDDVHMGRLGFDCIDCHRGQRHDIRGRAYSVGVDHGNGIGCTDCHADPPHGDARIDAHLDAVACQTCHIPTFARRLPTKTYWDWSKAGDASRPDDPHTYLKIKGEFVYDHDIVPEYAWFDLTMDRYLLGDRMDPDRETDINRPRGGFADPGAKIWPFKIHRALQHYDRKLHVLLPPVTGGDGGYWHDFDWDQALRLGAKASALDYSGDFGFAKTRMYWPLSHMVAPKEQALQCDDCHGDRPRLDFRALGYAGDPARAGGRR
jgi:octaheme c-type cytochrome (tetrathionate reductase family)